jgi:1-deoxy-D-xylulose-5-phosphate reductoisomerase
MGGVRRLAILGSTGSIGRQTLEVIRAFPDRFQVIGLAAGKNLGLLAEQIEEFHPKLVSHLLSAPPISPDAELLSLEEMASHAEVDLVVVATPGAVGLLPTVAAIQAEKGILLADKAVLVMAGEMVMTLAKERGVRILPLDSEHSAIWQCLRGEPQTPSRLILTASGGPFRNFPKEELTRVTPQEALKHPVWKMGQQITIDSATLMNKGMEVIEAHWLFGMPWENIEIIIHPEGIIHSLVEFPDGQIKAVLSPPDMRLPIQYALLYPERFPGKGFPRLSFRDINSLSFEMPDIQKFPCLGIAIEAGRMSGTYPAVLCGANEMAVELFLSHRIGFLDIAQVVKLTLDHHQPKTTPSLGDIVEAYTWAKEYAPNWHLR